MPPYRPLEEKFWEYIDIKGKNECWNWEKSKRNGYGRIRDKYRGVLSAHHVSWEIFYGEIPTGLKILHKCDNPSCVNPNHLFLGTQEDNVHDMWNKGRGADTSGENNGRSKINRKIANKIRKLYETRKYSYKKLSNEFDIGETQVGRIIRNEQWKDKVK